MYSLYCIGWDGMEWDGKGGERREEVNILQVTDVDDAKDARHDNPHAEKSESAFPADFVCCGSADALEVRMSGTPINYTIQAKKHERLICNTTMIC